MSHTTNINRFSKLTDPRFCVIAPIEYLDIYAVYSTTHLVLAHLVDTNEVYCNFYKTRSELGDTIIMDCSAFELGESYHPHKLVELGQKCGAHAIVLPDYPFQHSSKTIDAAMIWAKEIKQAGFATMFVPQSEQGDMTDWINCYNWAKENSDIDIIGMSILGIPNAWCHIPKMYARVVATEYLKSTGQFADNKYHHYLGLNSSPNVEVPSLLIMKALDSCDSSNPVWTGINGLQYNLIQDSYLPIAKKYLREVNFNEKMTSKQHIHTCIRHNLDITLDIFKNPTSYL